MEQRTAHLALYDGAAEMEVGHLLGELHTGRFTGTSFRLVTVAESHQPITSMGGVRMLPDAFLAELQPDDSDIFVMPGAEMWDAGGGGSFAAVAGRFLDAGSRWPRSVAPPRASRAPASSTIAATRATPPSISP